MMRGVGGRAKFMEKPRTFGTYFVGSVIQHCESASYKSYASYNIKENSMEINVKVLLLNN
jgi:hypothetical protein